MVLSTGVSRADFVLTALNAIAFTNLATPPIIGLHRIILLVALGLEPRINVSSKCNGKQYYLYVIS
jgi:hypothetical protein